MSAGEIVSIVAVGLTLLGVFAKLITVLNELSASIKSQAVVNENIIKTLDNHESRIMTIERKEMN